MATQPTCEHCRRKLRLGDNTIQLRHGVIGARGIIPLDDGEYFCDEQCLRWHLCGSPRRGEDLRVDDLDRQA